MANKVTIDVEARFIDNVTSEAKSATKSFNNLEKAAEETTKAVDAVGKSKPKVNVDSSNATKKLDNIDKKLNKLGRSKAEAKLSVMDKATAIIEKVTAKAKAFAGKTYSGLVKIRDSNVLSSLNKMSSGLKSLTGKAWNIAVKIKDTFTSPLRALKNSLFSIKTLITGIASAWAAVQFVKNPINVADAYSSAKISFSTLLGESQGQQMMDNLDEFAKATPFNTTNVISNAQKMLAMGWDAESIIDDMEIIGNAAAATGKLDVGLESIVRALSQIKTKGKLSTEELNQLAEAGISAKAMLAEQLGYGTGDEGIAAMTEDLEDGAIASGAAIEALLRGMQKYDGMMDSMANETVEGLWSQMQDAFSINIVRKWGQGLQDGAKRGFGSIVSLLDEAETGMAEFGDTLYEIGETASNWAADKLENAIKRVTDITDSFEFKSADLKEKISMLWNGVVVDPLREWWEGGGRDKTAETAGEIGAWMGKTITSGLLAIFGMTDVLDPDAMKNLGENGGMSIAQSFAQGFKDNFDGSAITDALVDAIGDVWGAFPAWAKFLIGGIGVGKVAGGISSLAGGIAGFASGTAATIGSATAMTGLMGYGTTAAINLGAGNLAAGASLGAGALTALGFGATAGGIAGVASLGKGVYDLYGSHKAYKEGNAIEGDAKAASGITTISGVGMGAAVGATLGSIIPGIGTAVGGLIGAGIGGIAGWISGNKWADEIRATDDAVNDVTAATEKLETEEEKLAAKAKMVWQNMKDHFGDIKLSASEIAAIANQIVWGDDMAYFEQFSTATQTAEASLKSLKSAAETTNKWMWKASLGIKFNQDEMESIAASFDEYITSAKSFVENKHYEFTTAVGLLVDIESEAGKTITSSGNAFYVGLQEQLNSLGEELSGTVEIALQDGVITLDEHNEIINLQQQIAAITEKVANAETEAELELIKVKFGSGNLDADSFTAFMTQMETVLNERIAANDEAFTVAVSGLNIQLAEGAIDQEEYDQQLQTITDGYNAKLEAIRAQVMGVELEIIGEAYEDVLGPDATAKLQSALETSLADGINPISWTAEQARQYLGVDSLAESSAAALAEVLGGVASQLELVTIPMTLDPEEKVNELDLDAGDFGIASEYTFAPTVNIEAKLGAITPISIGSGQLAYTQEYRGGVVGGPSAMEAFARGGDTGIEGIVGGSTRFVKVNEEAPEMIIPLSSQRRDRALDLWSKTGEILGVPGFARGGSTDGSQDEGIRFRSYGNSESAGGKTIQINLGGVKFEVNASGSDNASVVEAIKAQAGDLADYIVGLIADSLETEFENTPVRGGTA